MIKILNNPLDILFETIRKVNDITAELVFLSKEQCDGNWGFTQKDSDGNFLIGIAVELSWQDALEIIAHEAAHIMAKSHDKPETEQHDAEWEFWFDNIHKEYLKECMRIEKEMGAGKHERGSRRGGRDSRISLHRISNRLRLLYVSFNIKENTGSRRKAEKADKKI